jgi:hypothetical protein
MRYLVSCFALVAVSVLALTAIAQPPEKDGKKNDGKRAEMRERMLKEFDANKDGKLDDEERAKAREKMHEMRGARGGKKTGKGGPAGQFGGNQLAVAEEGMGMQIDHGTSIGGALG